MSIGATLAAARRHAGLTVAEVRQRTRVRENIVQGIEHVRWPGRLARDTRDPLVLLDAAH